MATSTPALMNQPITPVVAPATPSPHARSPTRWSSSERTPSTNTSRATDARHPTYAIAKAIGKCSWATYRATPAGSYSPPGAPIRELATNVPNP